jgi:hypothetical protein
LVSSSRQADTASVATRMIPIASIFFDNTSLQRGDLIEISFYYT